MRAIIVATLATLTLASVPLPNPAVNYKANVSSWQLQQF